MISSDFPNTPCSFGLPAIEWVREIEHRKFRGLRKTGTPKTSWEKNPRSNFLGSSEVQNTEDRLGKKSEIQFLGVFGRLELENIAHLVLSWKKDVSCMPIRTHATPNTKWEKNPRFNYSEDRNTELQMRQKSEIQFLGVFGRPEHWTPNEKNKWFPLFGSPQNTEGSLKTITPIEQGVIVFIIYSCAERRIWMVPEHPGSPDPKAREKQFFSHWGLKLL